MHPGLINTVLYISCSIYMSIILFMLSGFFISWYIILTFWILTYVLLIWLILFCISANSDPSDGPPEVGLVSIDALEAVEGVIANCCCRHPIHIGCSIWHYHFQKHVQHVCVDLWLPDLEISRPICWIIPINSIVSYSKDFVWIVIILNQIL